MCLERSEGNFGSCSAHGANDLSWGIGGRGKLCKYNVCS